MSIQLQYSFLLIITDTYEEAEKKAIILGKKPYAYSTDNEYRAKQKANEDTKYFQFKSISQASVSRQLNEINLDINSDLTKNICKSQFLSMLQLYNFLNFFSF